MEVVEDFESRPHKAVSLVIERDKNGKTTDAQSAAWLQRRQTVRKKYSGKGRRGGRGR